MDGEVVKEEKVKREGKKGNGLKSWFLVGSTNKKKKKETRSRITGT